MPPLLPRMYSITSCKDSQKNPSVAFSVVKYETPESKETRLGVATNWLDGLPLDHEDIKIPIYKVPTKTFGLPEDISKPIIMIGPGTGVAPFRGFLQKREALARANPSLRFAESWLFFGCRRKDEDYLYEADFNAFVENKTLTRLVSAFSREDPSEKKVYVQHKLAEHEEKNARLDSPRKSVRLCLRRRRAHGQRRAQNLTLHRELGNGRRKRGDSQGYDQRRQIRSRYLELSF